MNLARNQFYHYGLYNVPEENLEHYVHEQLSKPEDARRIRDQKYEDKAILFMKDTVKLNHQEVSREEFQKLFESKIVSDINS
jgi:trigger factor